MSSPENGAARCQPWDSGLVSRWPVSTTRGPGPKLTSPMALGRPGSTSCSSTDPKPDSRMTEARNPASSPSSPRTLGIRQTCRTSSTARSRSRLPSTAAANPGSALPTVIRSFPPSDVGPYVWTGRPAGDRGPGAGPGPDQRGASRHAQQLYGMYLSVAISEALGVMWMSLFCFIQLPKLCQFATLMQPAFVPAGGFSRDTV